MVRVQGQSCVQLMVIVILLIVIVIDYIITLLIDYINKYCLLTFNILIITNFIISIKYQIERRAAQCEKNCFFFFFTST